jgi:hypothetical protein
MVPSRPVGADHLVRDEQHVVGVADLPHPLEVPGRGREAAAGVLHGLDEDGGDAVRPSSRIASSIRSAAQRPNSFSSSGDQLRCPVEVGVRHPVAARDERLERGP